ncbi:MAG: caspase family protein, partial [Clostridia bacterium]
NALNVMILDACRNNPFARSFRSAAQGLAQMDAPSGTLIAFATAPGSVASDGDSGNGLYTQHLLANLERPGMPIELLFKEVRVGVTRATGDRQVPWESSSLKGDFYFVRGELPRSPEAQKLEVQKAVAEAVKREEEKAAEIQRQMQMTIQELLAKQKADLEQAMRQQGRVPPTAPEPQVVSAKSASPSVVLQPAKAEAVAIPVASSPKPAPEAATPEQPLQVASAAPASVAANAANSRLPTSGDEWQYVYTDILTRRQKKLAIDVVGVSPEGILDAGSLDGAAKVTSVHGPEALLKFIGGASEFWQFSPYLLAFGDLAPGRRWESLTPLNDHFCNGMLNCSYSGRVVGPDRVVVPAGTFDAIKVEIDLHSQRGTGWGRDIFRQATFWYAAKAKRIVKSTVRTLAGYGVTQPDYDLELSAYKVVSSN